VIHMPPQNINSNPFLIAGKYQGLPDAEARAVFQEIQGYISFPIVEVMNNYDKDKKPLSYAELQHKIRNGELNPAYPNRDLNGAFINLSSAYGEAIAVRGMRQYPASIVVHEPGKVGASAIDDVGNVPAGLGKLAIQSFNGKTPDALAYFQGAKIKTPQGELHVGVRLNVVDPKNPNRVIVARFEGKNVISPIEVFTGSGDDPNRYSGKLLKKIEKFRDYSPQVLGTIGGVEYVPILYVDADAFNKLSCKVKKNIVDKMAAINGRIITSKGLNNLSTELATSTCNLLNKRLMRRVVLDNSPSQTTQNSSGFDSQERGILSQQLMALLNKAAGGFVNPNNLSKAVQNLIGAGVPDSRILESVRLFNESHLGMDAEEANTFATKVLSSAKTAVDKVATLPEQKQLV
jgi:hypothetical protein